MARKKLQYDNLVQPILVVISSAPITLDQWLSYQQVPVRSKKTRHLSGGVVEPRSGNPIQISQWLSHQATPRKVSKNRHLYNNSVQPVLVVVPTAPNTLDQWLSYQPVPNRLKKNQYLYNGTVEPRATGSPVFINIGVFTASPVNIVSLSRFQYQARSQPLLPIIQAEVITLDRWFSNQPAPFRQKKTSHLRGGAVMPWQDAASKDVRGEALFRTQELRPAAKKTSHLRGGQFEPLGAITPVVVVTLDQWLQNASLPVRRMGHRRHLYPSPFFQKDFVAVVEEVTLDKWFAGVIPRRGVAKNLFYLYPFEGTSSLATTLPAIPIIGRHVILGLNRDSKTGIAVKSNVFLGRNTDAKTGIGTSLQQR